METKQIRRSPLDALITEKTLHFINDNNNFIIESMLEDPDYDALPMKNVCAKVTTKLAGDIDEIVGLLGISKRRFLEAAFLEAVQNANRIMDEEGLWEALEERTNPRPVSAIEQEKK